MRERFGQHSNIYLFIYLFIKKVEKISNNSEFNIEKVPCPQIKGLEVLYFVCFSLQF